MLFDHQNYDGSGSDDRLGGRHSYPLREGDVVDDELGEDRGILLHKENIERAERGEMWAT